MTSRTMKFFVATSLFFNLTAANSFALSLQEQRAKAAATITESMNELESNQKTISHVLVQIEKAQNGVISGAGIATAGAVTLYVGVSLFQGAKGDSFARAFAKVGGIAIGTIGAVAAAAGIRNIVVDRSKISELKAELIRLKTENENAKQEIAAQLEFLSE